MLSVPTQRPAVNPTSEPADEFAAAGLSPLEQYVVSELRLGRDLRDLARDPETARLFGRPPSHETVRLVGNRAQARLGTPGSVPEVRRAEAALALRERGRLVRAADLHADADTPRRRRSAAERAEAALERLHAAFVAEAGRGLSARRLAFYAERSRALAV